MRKILIIILSASSCWMLPVSQPVENVDVGLICIVNPPLQAVINDFTNNEKVCINQLQNNEAIYLIMGYSGNDTLIQIETRSLASIIENGTSGYFENDGQMIFIHPSVAIPKFIYETTSKKISISSKLLYEEVLYLDGDTVNVAMDLRPTFIQWNIWYSKVDGFVVDSKLSCLYEKQAEYLDSLKARGWKTGRVWK